MDDQPQPFPPAENPWGNPPPAGYGGGYAPPPSWPPAPPAPPPAGPRPPKRGLGALMAVALVAGLVGGGVGAAVTYGTTKDTPATVTSLTPVTEKGETKTIKAPEGSVEAVAAKVVPSVVSIEVRSSSRNPFTSGGSGSGSGVVISNDGLILTNNHVAGTGNLTVTFKDGRTVTAKLIKADPSSDLAVIKADGISDAVPIVFGKSSELAVGQTVVAVGSPLGLNNTVTAGIVSALQRPVVARPEAGDGDSTIDAIQTDAPINPGNSGGALVDMQGRLVGITTAIATLGASFGQSGSIGLGFAIPIDQARIIADQLAKGQTVTHALLGVSLSLADSLGETQRGALIADVSPDGAAAKAGLQKDDLVIKLDDRMIDNADALKAGVRSHQPGEEVKLTYIRGKDTKTVDVVLGSDGKKA
jgi:putative serine protease PepD